VSSTNIIGMENVFITLGKSFMFKRSNKGPDMDVCGSMNGGEEEYI
jgi:hypothetical protein